MRGQDETVGQDSGVQSSHSDVLAYVVKRSCSDVGATAVPLRNALAGQGKPWLQPPYDLEKLCNLADTSSILSACIDAMEVNVDCFGAQFVPSVQGSALEKLKRNKKAEQEMETEQNQLMEFFGHLHHKLPTIQLRRLLRRDYELTGNGYWELLRNPLTGALTGVEHLPARHMRMGLLDEQPTVAVVKRKKGSVEIDESLQQRRFRRLARLAPDGSVAMWFKEFGDPRLMDAHTGGRAVVKRDSLGRVQRVIAEQDPEFPFDMAKYRQGNMQLATQVLHFCLSSSPCALPYGVPRWIGALTPLVGLRLAEEANVMYFDHKTVPPGMLLVSGGNLSQQSVERISTHIRDHIKGKENFHSILVVEAKKDNSRGMLGQSTPTLQWVKMTDAQQQDALFQQYELGSIEKVIGCFRFWSGFVGRTKEINVATARVARELSEEQVFAPEREAFDALINRTLLPELGINYWLYKSKGPQLTTPRETAELLQHSRDYLSIQEGRTLVGKVFGREFPKLQGKGLDTPLGV